MVLVKGFPRQWIADKFQIEGTRYNLGTIGEYEAVGELIDPATAAKSALREGAVVAGALAVGEDVYAYGWGNKKSTGLSSTEFAAAVTVDTTIAVSSAVAGAAAGALVGSIVPGVGTVVGAAFGWVVGTGIDWLAKKDTGVFGGKSFRDWTVGKLTDGIDALTSGKDVDYAVP